MEKYFDIRYEFDMPTVHATTNEYIANDKTGTSVLLTATYSPWSTITKTIVLPSMATSFPFATAVRYPSS